jgi:hypothetical protein
MASGHVNRANRPNTWLHRPTLQTFKKVLANSEPSTHGGKADITRTVLEMSLIDPSENTTFKSPTARDGQSQELVPATKPYQAAQRRHVAGPRAEAQLVTHPESARRAARWLDT